LQRWAAPGERAVTSDLLTATLAEKVMHWGVAPDRFLLGNRQWISRTQFQPLNRVQDAFRLLRKLTSMFSLTSSGDGVFTAAVRIGDRTGRASGESEAATILLAVARALRRGPESRQPPKTGVDRR